MKNILILLFTFISVSFAQLASPKISIKETNYDFGTITEGSVVNHNFEVQNVGDMDLKIAQVRASCGCTAAQPLKTELKPGEKTSIKVEFDSANRLGQQEKHVYVMSNDPVTPELNITFTTVVVDRNTQLPKDMEFSKLKLNLQNHDFGKVEEGKIVKATISFKNTGNDVLKINDVKTSCGCTAALVSSKILKPGETGSVKIELDTTGRDGELTRTVTLYSNDPKEPNQTITLFVNIIKRKS
jgi:hypothetical protein